MLKSQIQDYALGLGFDGCRFTTAQAPEHSELFQRWIDEGNHGQMEYLARNAAKRVDPQQVLPGAKSILTLAVSYGEELRIADCGLPVLRSSPTAEGGRIGGGEPSDSAMFSGQTARYSRFTDYHDVLAAPLKALTEFLHQVGGPETRSLWYVDTGPLLERDLAQRAGLGFVGKHTNLVSRDLGNWFFLSEILTTLEIEPDTPEKNRCGSCSRCLEACPTGAITAPFKLDARRCISYLTIELKGSIPVEFRRAIGSRIYGCDDCLAACPWNRFARDGALMRPHQRGEWLLPELLELLDLDNAAFKQRFTGTPMLRTKRRGLLRNVCVALGNIGDETVLPGLERAALDPEPIIAEHALWAISEIKMRSSRPK